MKKTVITCFAALSLTALASFAHAAQPGSYAGLGLGIAKQETSRNLELSNGASSYSHDQDKLAARIFAGYNFSENFGIETGFAKYGDSHYKINGSGKLDYTLKALDIVGKAYLPLGEGFNIYGLAGLAYARSHVRSTTANISKTNSRVRPIYGFGASYDIPKTQLTTNLEFSRLQGYGNVKNSTSAIPSADMLTLNLSYNFG